jgi:TetR/AcrR family transcriptional regulator, regulator of cefoperazone and chloramphenicol sensitivity
LTLSIDRHICEPRARLACLGLRLSIRAETRRRQSRHHRGELTRRRILETALEAFAIDGYEGVTTRQLAERAGVTLPAIQYYFGSKEGLYRAAIDHLVRQIEERMAPVANRIKAALAKNKPSRRELLALLQELLAAFIALVVGGAHPQSRRLLLARCEIDRTAASDALHECGKQQILEPCVALVEQLLPRPASREESVLRALLLLGQITAFGKTNARRALGWADFTPERVRTIEALVHEHTDAIFRAGADAR